jgi:hypothetical protein
VDQKLLTDQATKALRKVGSGQRHEGRTGAAASLHRCRSRDQGLKAVRVDTSTTPQVNDNPCGPLCE